MTGQDLDQRGLVFRLQKRVHGACGQGGKPYRKEAKYYLPFPYRASLCTNAGIAPPIGSLREEFFINHVDCCFNPTAGSASADFTANGMSFEVGGEGKSNKQIAGTASETSATRRNGTLNSRPSGAPTGRARPSRKPSARRRCASTTSNCAAATYRQARHARWAA